MTERGGRLLLAAVFVSSGILHFAVPNLYVRIVPPLFAHQTALVLISGAAEILGGIGLLHPSTRRLSGYGLALLLVAVFPANIYMVVAHVPDSGIMGQRWLQWLRLPLQLPLIVWALHYAKPASRARDVIF